jgi:hypothetical protein
VEHVDDLEELNSDYIKEHFGELQDEAYQRGINDGSLDVKQRVEGAYQRGLNDAWQLAEDAIYNRGNVLDILRCATVGAAFDKYSARQALDILKGYESKQKDCIKVGDEVERYVDGRLDGRAMFMAEDNDSWACLFWTGCGYTTLSYPKSQFKRTGRHYEIEPILEGIRNES